MSPSTLILASFPNPVDWAIDKATGFVGNAAGDASFSGGSDRLRYHVHLPAGRRLGRIAVELRYQPIAYRWARNLASYAAPEPTRFVTFFDRLSSSASVVVATADRDE